MSKKTIKLPSKSEAWRYLKTHYASLYLYGFGGLCFLVSLFGGVFYLRGELPIDPKVIVLMVFLCFGYTAWKVFSEVADRAYEKESKTNGVQ